MEPSNRGCVGRPMRFGGAQAAEEVVLGGILANGGAGWVPAMAPGIQVPQVHRGAVGWHGWWSATASRRGGTRRHPEDPSLWKEPAPSPTQGTSPQHSPSSSCRVVPSCLAWGPTIYVADHNPPGSYTIPLGTHTPLVSVHNPTRVCTSPRKHTRCYPGTTLHWCVPPLHGHAEHHVSAHSPPHTPPEPAQAHTYNCVCPDMHSLLRAGTTPGESAQPFMGAHNSA